MSVETVSALGRWDFCRETDAPYSAADHLAYASHPPAWQSGVAGAERQVMLGSDSGVMAVVTGLLVLIGLSMRYLRRLFKAIPQDLFSVRRRANVFDEHTANESRVVMLLLLQLFVSQGVLLYMWLGGPVAAGRALTPTVLALAALSGAFYLFGLVGCITLGYVFTDSVNAGLLRRGLNASQIVLGLTLAIPTLFALFYPALTHAMLVVAAGLYVVLRLCYISKGFRIFYHNFPSLLYFILYLCTLEIIPVIIACILAREICVNLN